MSSQLLRFPSNDCLADELCALGVFFLQGGKQNPKARVSGLELLSGLAASDEARLRLAIIPLLLQCPDLATHVQQTVTQLSSSAQLALRCYYTAAVLLQQNYWTELQSLLGTTNRLPDQFSVELGLRRRGTTSEQLQALADRHAFLSGIYINWLGTYEHAAQRFITSMQRKKEWQL
jgi:hypothetical protein